jgi:hypothetical protein
MKEEKKNSLTETSVMKYLLFSIHKIFLIDIHHFILEDTYHAYYSVWH